MTGTLKVIFNSCARKLRKISFKTFDRKGYFTELCDFVYNFFSMIAVLNHGKTEQLNNSAEFYNIALKVK